MSLSKARQGGIHSLKSIQSYKLLLSQQWKIVAVKGNFQVQMWDRMHASVPAQQTFPGWKIKKGLKSAVKQSWAAASRLHEGSAENRGAISDSS